MASQELLGIPREWALEEFFNTDQLSTSTFLSIQGKNFTDIFYFFCLCISFPALDIPFAHLTLVSSGIMCIPLPAYHYPSPIKFPF